MELPARNPVACGALGDYDSDLVAALAVASTVPLEQIHAGRRSVLMLDRPPIRWRAGLTRGWAWSELGPADPGTRIADWRQAATDRAACGLVVSPRSSFVHTSVSGLTPLHWVDHEGATYFATSIDALARAIPGRWSVDWAAWASIICVRYPVGEATPFAELRRMRPFSTLSNRDGTGRAAQHRWPLLDVVPDLSLDESVDRAIEALERTMMPLRGRETLSLLSGGYDSRVLLCLLDDLGIPRRALTLSHDGRAAAIEVETATAAAQASVTPHEVLAPSDPERHWEFWLERTRAVGFQVVWQPWLARLGDRIEELGLPAVDGLALDVFGYHTGRNFTPKALALAGRPEAATGFWLDLRRGGLRRTPERMLGADAVKAVLRESRRQFTREWRRVSDSPSDLVLLHYVTRTLRGVATMPSQVLGARAQIVCPGATYAFAEAALRSPMGVKSGNAFYRILLTKLRSAAASEPIEIERREAQADPGPQAGDALRFSSRMAAHYTAVLRDSVLLPHLAPDLQSAIREGTVDEAIRNHSLQRALMLATTFTLWHEQYRDRLGSVDPAALGEL